MRFETKAVHAGRKVDPVTGAVTTPIHLSTTYERAADGSYAVASCTAAGTIEPPVAGKHASLNWKMGMTVWHTPPAWPGNRLIDQALPPEIPAYHLADGM